MDPPAPLALIGRRCVGCEAELNADRCASCGVAARAGPYRIIRVLAQELHGRMYLAVDEAGMRVALKELLFSLVPSATELEAFAREAKFLAELDHPRIPRFLRSFTAGEGPTLRLYLAQEFIEGESLAQKMAGRRFSEQECVAIAEETLQILDFLHQRSPAVLHRDIKPGNLILGTDGHVRLVDFGAARDLRARSTHRSTLVGTFGYMAPEQMGGTASARSDLYGVGATLVELLTRKPPEETFHPGMALEVAKLGPLSRSTQRLVTRLTALRPEERFESAADALLWIRSGIDRSQRINTRALAVVFGLFAAIAAGLAAWGMREQEVTRTPPAITRPAPVAPAPLPPPIEKLPVPVEPGPPVEPMPPPQQSPVPIARGPRPPDGEAHFSFVLADWQFNKPGPWLLDGSGHGHHAPYPSDGGFQLGTNGLEWTGGSGFTVADDSTILPEGPFVVSATFVLDANAKVGDLIWIGERRERALMSVGILPGRDAVFDLGDAAGKHAILFKPLGDVRGGFPQQVTLHAMFDPETGTMTLYESCHLLGTRTTNVRPWREMPRAKVHLLSRFAGSVTSIGINKGLLEISGGALGCSWRGIKMD